MPCYTRWNTYLEPNSEEYRQALLELVAKFKAVKHVIDYYLKARNQPLPNAKYSGWGSQYELVGASEQYKSVVIEVTHHLLCDGINQDNLLDIESILSKDNPKTPGYAYILLACHLALRANEVAYINLSDEDQEMDRSWFKLT